MRRGELGWTQQQIADRLGISRPQIWELIARHGVIPPQDELPGETLEFTEGEPDSDAVPEPEPEPEPEPGRPGRRRRGAAGRGSSRN
ncbi:helix-turn-helix domain-containing protein [Streptomyces sp. MnatMP-M17]|uniref:helix-turn-helix domain-containing protein n=1 Tax=Streptomyces sp. MnatMP-M17 TaxID=1839780 RepID=UPI003521E3C7